MSSIEEVARKVKRNEEIRAFGATVDGSQNLSLLEKWAAILRKNIKVNITPDTKNAGDKKTFSE
jgi:hypothetical protein